MKAILGSLAAIVVFAVLGFGLYLGWQAFTEGRRQAQAAANTAVVSKTVAAEGVEGHAAVQDVQASADFEAKSKALTRSNTNAIESAPGAEVPVQPDEYNAALRALCLRNVYRNDPTCIRLRHPAS